MRVDAERLVVRREDDGGDEHRARVQVDGLRCLTRRPRADDGLQVHVALPGLIFAITRTAGVDGRLRGAILRSLDAEEAIPECEESLR